jgi:hypothetical protein
MDRSDVQLAATAAGLVAAAYAAICPPLAEVRAGTSVPEASMTQAAVVSATAVLALALASGSMTTGIVGGGVTAGFAAAYRDAADRGRV